MNDFWECVVDWVRNIAWVSVSFGVFYLIIRDVTIAALLTIALSDLYIHET